MEQAIKQAEAILFAVGKPMKRSRLAKLIGVEAEKLQEVLDAIEKHFNEGVSGIQLMQTDTEVALTTNPEVADFIRDELKKDVMGELTKPSVETLAIIAYRGPITRPEMEQIRGVNCSMILRNLMIRGLIEEVGARQGQTLYTVTMPFLQHLGVSKVAELPAYDELNADQLLTTLLERDA